MRSEVLPVGLRLSGRRALVVGTGGDVERRAALLRESGAVVLVVASGAFDEADLDDVWIAVLTDLDPVLAARIFRAAEARRVFFCAVDQPDFCTFSHLALARSGDVTLAVSTNGKAPALARRLREELERVLRESGLEAFVERISALRDETASSERQRVLGAAVQGVTLTGKLVVPDDDATD